LKRHNWRLIGPCGSGPRQLGEIVLAKAAPPILHLADHCGEPRDSRGRDPVALPRHDDRPEQWPGLSLALAHRKIAPDAAACLGRVAIVIRHLVAARRDLVLISAPKSFRVESVDADRRYIVGARGAHDLTADAPEQR